jgi:hypothetical protein
MSDIVERLRWWAYKFCGKGVQEDDASDVMTNAIHEIENLRKDRRAMQGALLSIKAHTQGAHPMSYMDQLCRIARAALGEKE